MLDFADKDSKAAIIKMFKCLNKCLAQELKANMLNMSKKTQEILTGKWTL